MNSDNQSRFNRRLDKFKQAIRKYQDQQLALIHQKAKDEQDFERNKIFNESRERDENYFHKKQKNLETDLKIMKSRKINESRMAKMKLRHEFVERIQQEIKNALARKINDQTIYRELLKQLIMQGLIKMLEENVEVKCLKKDLALVKELAYQCQRQFNQSSTIQTKVTVNERQFLSESDIGGIEVTSNNGRIVCNNTLAARLEYSVQKLLPDIRSILFSHRESSPKRSNY